MWSYGFLVSQPQDTWNVNKIVFIIQNSALLKRLILLNVPIDCKELKILWGMQNQHFADPA